MQKFENMDVIAALEAIMHQNTAYYQSDFAYDIKMLREAARSDQPEDKLLLWLSRPSGTFCFRERDVLLKDTQAYNTWKFCGEQTHDRILAYAVELTGTANGTLQGNLYELDYQQHFQHIREAALPMGANRLIYESGMREIGPKEHFDSRPRTNISESSCGMKCSPVTRNFCKRSSVRSNAAGNLHGPVISKNILRHCTLG